MNEPPSSTPAGEPAGDDDAALQAYLKKISQIPGLSREQETELARQIEAGLAAEVKLGDAGERLPAGERVDLEWAVELGARARNHLLEANLRLVASLAKRYTGRGLTYPGLIRAGNRGLIRALERFDYTKGYALSTYATWWIRQAITRALAGRSPGEEPPEPPGPAGPPG